MNLLFRYLAIFLICFTQVNLASARPLLVHRNDKNQVVKIDFPPGFSVEYMYTDTGHLSDKKFINFTKYFSCPGIDPSTPEYQQCMKDRVEARYADGVLQESTLLGLDKIPSLYEVLNQHYQSNPKVNSHPLQNLYTMLTLLLRNVATLELQNQKVPEDEIPERVETEALALYTTLSGIPEEQIQANFLGQKITEYMKRFQLNEQNLKNQSSIAWSPKQKAALQKAIDEIGTCNQSFAGYLQNRLDQNKIRRSTVLNADEFATLEKIIDRPDTILPTDSDSTFTLGADATHTEIAQFQAIVDKVFAMTDNYAHHSPYDYLDQPNDILFITDHIPAYGMNFSLLFPMSFVGLRSELFGDPSAVYENIFRKDLNALTWLMGHEHGHIKQSFDVSRELESTKLYAFAVLVNDIILKEDLPQTGEGLTVELFTKITNQLLRPTKQLFESSATYFGLDQYPCF